MSTSKTGSVSILPFFLSNPANHRDIHRDHTEMREQKFHNFTCFWRRRAFAIPLSAHDVENQPDRQGYPRGKQDTGPGLSQPFDSFSTALVPKQSFGVRA